jgi:hypothetical protein
VIIDRRKVTARGATAHLPARERSNLGRAESKSYTEMYRDHYEIVAGSCQKPPRNSCGDD